MYVYDSINSLCTLMTTVMSFTLLDSHKPISAFEYSKSIEIDLHDAYLSERELFDDAYGI